MELRGSIDAKPKHGIQPRDNAKHQVKPEGQTSQGTTRQEGPESWSQSHTYIGDGLWDIPEEGTMINHKQMPPADTWERLRMEIGNEDLMRAKVVGDKGYPNMFGARIPVPSKWNLDVFQELLKDYDDKEVIQGLKFGWPTGRLPTLKDPTLTFKNHQGAVDHPQALRKYIKKEAEKGAIIGPFNKIPFNKVGISPISTRPKKNSQEHRVIVDLSFPPAVNDGMVKGNYIGFTAELTFPRTDDLAFRIAQLGNNAQMFKIDLSRYFRQIPLDPADYSMIGYVIDGELYFDKVLPMGMRSAPYIAQRITNAIAFIHRQAGYFLLNYVDDFLGAEHKEKVQQAFTHLTQLLSSLGVETAPEKIVPPTTRIEFLGVTFDSITMTIEVTPERVKQMLAELNSWNTRIHATRKEVESLIGKLQFASKCVKPGRTFIARLIEWLKTVDRKRKYSIPKEARKDIAWWGKFLENYNGISLLWLTNIPTPDTILASDACTKGFGAICSKQYIKGTFPEQWHGNNIAHLEMLAVLAEVRTWKEQITGKYFWILVDNEAVATILNTGASRDTFLQNALREIMMLAAHNNFMIKAKHIRGVDNRIPDWLSRWGEQEARQKFLQYEYKHQLKQIQVENDIILLNNTW